MNQNAKQDAKRHRRELPSRERGDEPDAPPLTDGELEAMFADLDTAVVAVGCDGSRRLTEAWLAQHGHPAAPVLLWLANHGGYCDCEVLLNAQIEWESRRPRGPATSC